MTFSVFWNDSWFNDVVSIARTFGVSPSQWLDAILEAMESDAGPVGRLLQDFIRETRDELFDSPEQCHTFYSDPARFDQLCRGQIGDNLLYKYRAIASFFLWSDVCRLALNVTERLLRERGAAGRIADFDELWTDLSRFVEARHATGTAMEELTRPVVLTMRHDVPAWLAEGVPVETGRFRLNVPEPFVFRLSTEGARELEAALAVWTPRAIGLSKLITRIRHTAQVRECERGFALAGTAASMP